MHKTPDLDGSCRNTMMIEWRLLTKVGIQATSQPSFFFFFCDKVFYIEHRTDLTTGYSGYVDFFSLHDSSKCIHHEAHDLTGIDKQRGRYEDSLVNT